MTQNLKPNLLFLDFKDEEDNDIYEIELNKNGESTVKTTAVLGLSADFLNLFTIPRFMAFVFLTIETSENETAPSFYISQQYIEIPIDKLNKDSLYLTKVSFSTNINTNFSQNGKNQQFDHLVFKLSLTTKGPGEAGTSLAVEDGVFLSSNLRIKRNNND